MLIVQKFGGTSLADETCIRRVSERTAERIRLGDRVVTVVSAQGDETDRLLRRATKICGCCPLRELDMMLATGEQQSAALLAMALEGQGVPAVSLTGWQAGVHTDDVFGNARILDVDTGRIQRELADGRAVVVAGFQGVSGNGDVTTLGRGGSDTTAVALAAALNADQCLIYTDVDGVYDRDPRIFPDARRYDCIDYETMLAMARNGAQVLHDRCVELAMQKGVRLTVLSAFADGPGTEVGERL